MKVTPEGVTLTLEEATDLVCLEHTLVMSLMPLVISQVEPTTLWDRIKGITEHPDMDQVLESLTASREVIADRLSFTETDGVATVVIAMSTVAILVHKLGPALLEVLQAVQAVNQKMHAVTTWVDNLRDGLKAIKDELPDSVQQRLRNPNAGAGAGAGSEKREAASASTFPFPFPFLRL